MNDYKLINSLLADGSPQSLLKLKTIVDIKTLNKREIDLANQCTLVYAFPDYYETFILSHNHTQLLYIFEQNNRTMEVIKLFSNSFEKLYSKHQYLLNDIQNVHIKKQIIDFFPNIKWNTTMLIGVSSYKL